MLKIIYSIHLGSSADC